MLMRAGGFAAMARRTMSRGCCGLVHTSGLGGTLFDPPRAALVVSWCVRISAAALSILMMRDSAGAVIGALLGSWLLRS